jgi:hypothetical protein
MYQAQLTKRAVEAAVSGAAAATREAVASEHLIAEAQHTRELDFQPLLVPSENSRRMPKGMAWMMSVANSGRGPAYEVLVVGRTESGALLVSRPMSLGAGEARAPGIRWRRFELSPAIDGLIPPGDGLAFFCEDQFGHRYRFLEDGSRPDVARSDEPEPVVHWAQVWHLGEGESVVRPGRPSDSTADEDE